MARRITLRKSMPVPAASVWADSRRLRQVWINLLSHAVKFTPEGGWVEVAVEWQPGGGVLVRVADCGIGIAEEDIDSVRSEERRVGKESVSVSGSRGTQYQ